MTETRRLRARLEQTIREWRVMTANALAEGAIPGDDGHGARWHAIEFCADHLSALLSEPQAAPAPQATWGSVDWEAVKRDAVYYEKHEWFSGPQVVYVVDGGDYENYGWDAVYDSLDAAILDNPLPEMRAILGKQVDPTFALRRAGGWMPVTEYQRSPLGEWWNGFDSDFGKYIHAVELRVAASPVLPAPPEDDKP